MAIFYFRDPNSADTVAEIDSEKQRAKQANLKQRLRQQDCHIEHYNQAEDLKNLVIEPLWQKIQQYGKGLAEKPMQELLAHSQTANPLYLQVILEELRVFGEFDKLEDHLKGYLQTQTIPTLYEKVLARLEADYQPEGFEHLVADTLSLLWASRQGLNEAELLKILNIPQAFIFGFTKFLNQ